MRRRLPPVDFSHVEPPAELLRFQTRASSPTWTPGDFAAWLRSRAAWRGNHPEPLPGLPARERCALTSMDLPAALVEAEKSAPRKPPEWVERAAARRSGSGE
jgi:hypothetical protein